MAQDTNLGMEAATRYLPEGNLGTTTMTKVFKNSLISGSLLNQGCRRIHTLDLAVWGLFQNAVNKTHAAHISRVFRTLLGCLKTSVPMVKTKHISTRFGLLFISLSMSTHYHEEDTSPSAQCLENRKPPPFYCCFTSRWGDAERRQGDVAWSSKGPPNVAGDTDK